MNLEDKMKRITRILGLKELNGIVKVEQETWITPMQASRELIEKRIKLGHQILGYEINNELAGIVSWCYKKTNTANLGNISDPDRIPGGFEDFVNFSSGKSTLENANSAFIYNVGVANKYRGQGIGTEAVKAALMEIKKNGIKHVFLDGRCPSYNGSKKFPQEQVEPNPEFKKRIDECIEKERLPSVEVMKLDPTLRFYYKLNFRPFKLIAKFYKADIPTGGNRLIVYQEL